VRQISKSRTGWPKGHPRILLPALMPLEQGKLRAAPLGALGLMVEPRSDEGDRAAVLGNTAKGEIFGASACLGDRQRRFPFGA
jgi:hypothetical protein